MTSPKSIHDHRVHSRRRARQRAHLKLSRKAEATIIAAIERGRAEYIRTKENGVHVYNVAYRGRSLKVYFDHEQRCIRTVGHGGAV